MPRALGQISTSSMSRVPVSATTYTEPTSGAQRSLVSTSANDAAAGTGARTVRITYYALASDGTITGPFVETVTLNGTTPVATVNTNICLIEKLEVLTAGSGGVAAGTISLNTKSDGTGTTIVSIATGAVRTFTGVHYVPSNRQCQLTDLELAGGDTTTALVEVVRTPYPLAVEQSITGPYGTTATLPRGVSFTDAAKAPIPGPARVRLMVTPGSVTAQTTYASFGYVDTPSQAF